MIRQELSRPTLAKLNEDFPKIRTVADAAEVTDLMSYIIRILNIKVASKAEQDEMDFQMPIILDFIKSKFGTLTIPEIKEAFKMYVAREFEGIKVFRILDCILVGEILTAYTDFRNESLRIYDSKKQTLLLEATQTAEVDKKAIREAFLRQIFDDLNKKGYSNDVWLLWEEDFKTKKLTPFAEKVNATVTKEAKIDLYEAEERVYLMQLKAEQMVSRNQSAKWAVENANDQIKKNLKIHQVVHRCRCIIGSNYLKNYLTDFEEFKNQIENDNV